MRRREWGPEPLYAPSKGAQASHLTHLRTKGKATKMSVTYKKLPDCSLPVGVFCTQTNHSPDLSDPHLVSSRGIFVCQGQTLVRLGFTLIFFSFLFPQENLQRQAGLRLFSVRKIVLIMTIECFPDQGEKKKLMFRSTKMIWFHSGEQIFSYSHAPPQLFLINLKPNSIFLFVFYRGLVRCWNL